MDKELAAVSHGYGLLTPKSHWQSSADATLTTALKKTNLEQYLLQSTAKQDFRR